jgi:hypothetical protein
VCNVLLLAEKREDSSRTSTAKKLLLHSVRTCGGRYHHKTIRRLLTSAEGGL